jgi:hypothetical protein
MEYLLLKRDCIKCGEEISFEVLVEDIMRWKEGLEIRLSMPYLCANEKRFLTTGLCEEC